MFPNETYEEMRGKLVLGGCGLNCFVEWEEGYGAALRFCVKGGGTNIALRFHFDDIRLMIDWLEVYLRDYKCFPDEGIPLCDDKVVFVVAGQSENTTCLVFYFADNECFCDFEMCNTEIFLLTEFIREKLKMAAWCHYERGDWFLRRKGLDGTK